MSVVIITRNRQPELTRTLRLMTALPERPAIFVVDNASADGSAAAASFAGVEVIRSERNLGAVGRNVAGGRVVTRYVAFCDDDTWWDPGALRQAADLLDSCPPLACVTAKILVEPGATEDPIVPELRDSPLHRPAWLPGPALVSMLAGASMFRSQAFRQVGGFSPRLRLGGEEELLGLDLASAGWWMCYADNVVVHHLASAVRDPLRRRILGSATRCGPPGCAVR